jgi:hypothetical protein
VKPKTMMVLEMCVENGLAYGWARAHKHTEQPTDQQIKSHQLDEIMKEIYEWFDMNDQNVS